MPFQFEISGTNSNLHVLQLILRSLVVIYAQAGKLSLLANASLDIFIKPMKTVCSKNMGFATPITITILKIQQGSSSFYVIYHGMNSDERNILERRNF